MWETLIEKIKSSYESGITTIEAEKLAGEFLYAQIQVSTQLAKQDLDAKMRKSGVKAVRSAVRSEEVKKHDKKPTESALDDVVNLNEIVQAEQDKLDNAEVSRDELERLYNIFRESHLHFRSIARGSFGG
jgi:mevalonate kinase